MISNSWNKIVGENISQNVFKKIKPEQPIKNKINLAQKQLEFQISKKEA